MDFIIFIIIAAIIAGLCLKYLNGHECKYGDIKGDYQFCKTCHKAKLVECAHKWVNLESADIIKPEAHTSREKIIGKSYIQQCSNCGRLKQENFEI
jgi:hypothetical protein